MLLPAYCLVSKSRPTRIAKVEDDPPLYVVRFRNGRSTKTCSSYERKTLESVTTAAATPRQTAQGGGEGTDKQREGEGEGEGGGGEAEERRRRLGGMGEREEHEWHVGVL